MLRRQISKMTALTVVMTLLLSIMNFTNIIGSNVMAQDATSTLYSEDFESTSLNAIPSGWAKVKGAAVTETDFGIVATDPSNSNNKVFKIKKASTGTGTILGASKTLSTIKDKMTVKFRYMTTSITSSYNSLYMGASNCVSLYQAGTKFCLIGPSSTTTIKSDVAPNTWYDIELRVDNVAHTLNAYINGALVGTNLPYRSTNNMDRFWFTIGDTLTGEFFIDNLTVINSANSVTLDDDPGDYTYFNNHEMNTSTDLYMNFQSVPKTNTITCNRYDYKNVNHNDKIILNKIQSSPTDNDDCFFNINLNRDSHYNSTKTYNNFLIEGDFTVTKLGSKIQAFLIRDTVAEPDVSFTTANILANGDLQYSDGTIKTGVALLNTAFNYKLAVNLTTHTADIYVNNVLVKTVTVPSTINNLNMVRLTLDVGLDSGTLEVNNFKVTGLVQPYQNGVLTRTSIFPNDTAVKTYLGDKVAFQAYRGTLFANGVKTQLNPVPYYDKTNNLIYVTTDVLATAFGINPALLTITNNSNIVTYNGVQKTLAHAVITYNSTLVVPVKDFATTVLAKYSNDDSLGLIIFSSYPFYANDLGDQTPFYLIPFDVAQVNHPTDVQAINDYMFFERQTAADIQSSFNSTTNNGAIHPRLFASQADFNRLKSLVVLPAPSQTPNPYTKVYLDVIARADAELVNPVVSYTYDDDYRMRVACTATLDKMRLLGFAYQMTGDIKYVNYAWSNIQSIATFPDLNTSHPIDTGDFCAGLAFCYDLMYNGLTQAQRDTISTIIIEKGLKPLQSAYYGGMTSASAANPGWSYTKWTSNYNTVINGGAILAALAVAEKDPTLSFDVVEKGIRSLEYTMKGFPLEGGWIEGSSYASEFVAGYLCYITASLKNSTGSSMGITKYQGLDGLGMFLTSLQAPQGVNNFHDTDTTNNTTHQLTHWTSSWLSSEFGQTGYAANRQLWLTRGKTPDPMDVLFFNPSASFSTLPLASMTKGTECFSFRNSFTNVSDIFASAHFGAQGGYHSQCDTGTFVFDISGVRWAADLGKENYNAIGTDEQLYRKRPEGHNVVVINPNTTMGQSDDGFTPIANFQTNAGGGFAYADLTNIYNSVSSYKRGFYVGDLKKTLTIRDEMDLTSASTVYWFMHTAATAITISADNKSATLTSGTKYLRLSLDTNATNVTISFMDAVGLPESQLIAANQSSTAGYKKVAIKLTGATGSTYLTVKLESVASPTSPSTAIMTTPISGW